MPPESQQLYLRLAYLPLMRQVRQLGGELPIESGKIQGIGRLKKRWGFATSQAVAAVFLSSYHESKMTLRT